MIVTSAMTLACSTGPAAVADSEPAPGPAKASEQEAGPRAVAEAATGAPAVSSEACALEPQWPMFQGDQRRSGTSQAPPIATPTVRWATRVGIQTWNNNPIVVGPMVIVGSAGDAWNTADQADGVYAVDRADGALRWFRPFAGDVNGVALAGCRIVVGSDDGTIRGLDPLTGEVAWKHSYGSKAYAQPLPVPGGVVVGGASGILRKLDTLTGSLLWEVELNGEIRQGAAFDGASIWVGTTDGTLWRVSPDGITHGSRSIDGDRPIWGAPTITDDGAIVGFVRETTFGTPALAGFGFDGTPSWGTVERATRKSWANVRTSPAFVDGQAYHAEAYSRDVVAWDPGLGRVVDIIGVGRCQFPQWASPIANAGQLVIPRHDGGFYAIDRAERQPLWGLELGSYDGSGEVKRVELDGLERQRCTWQPRDGTPLFATPAVDRQGVLYQGSGGGWLFAIGDADRVD